MGDPKEIIIDPSKCSRCFMCQLACSFILNKVFNPSESKILISWDHDGDCRIAFKEDCKKCGLCARYCIYGALSLAKE